MNAGRREEIRTLIAKANAYEDHPLTDLECELMDALEECFEELESIAELALERSWTDRT